MYLTRNALDMQPEYEALAQAIILQAVEDYRSARQRLRQPRYRQSARKTIQRLEGFFCSRWCGLLADVDGEKLIAELRREKAG